MTNRSFILTDSVVKNATNVTNQPATPNGKTLVIQKIGLTDESKSDKPSIVRFKFGGVIFRVLCVTTGTVEIPVGLEFIGNGTKALTVDRENTESNDKPITVWVEAYEK